MLETIRQRVVAGDLVLDIAAPPPVADEDDLPEAADDAPRDEDPDEVVVTLSADEVAAAAHEPAADAEPAEVEVDPAAQEAYDLALDLLDGEEDLDGWSDDELDDDDRFVAASLEDPDLADELGLDLDEDEDDALW